MAGFGVVMKKRVMMGMRKLLVVVLMVFSLGTAGAVLAPVDSVSATTGDECSKIEGSEDFLMFPAWYRRLLRINSEGTCDIGQPCQDDGSGCPAGSIRLAQFIWTIVLNISDVLFRLAGMIAVGFVLYAGFLYLTTQGQSSKIENAKKTLQNALIGLVIAILATAIINTIIGVIT